MAAKPKTGAIAPWFGSNRMLAEHVGRELAACEWVGVPFAGGMCELPHINARTMHVADTHDHVINLARVIADPVLKDQLKTQLAGKLFHPVELRDSQQFCQEVELADGLFGQPRDPLEWAVHYFVSVWMARSGQAGTDGEFSGKVATRWDAGGGDSAVRFHSAIDSLDAWHAVALRCTFEVVDCFEFLAKCKDRARHGIYCDPPFPGPGDGYKHKFTEAQHRQLAGRLAEFRVARVVCRFYDHPLVRELYPENLWTWRRLVGRKATNAEAPEVLIVN